MSYQQNFLLYYHLLHTIGLCVKFLIGLELTLCIFPDLPFLQGLLDIFPFASDDLGARSALWSIIARLLVGVKENEMSQSSLHHYVLVLASKSDLIEDDLLDQQFDKSTDESNGLTSSGAKANARSTAVSYFF